LCAKYLFTTMRTENIEKVFVEYLKTEKTQYALLVNGSWGCGKTFFWKENLAKLAGNEGFKTIYLSLNGLSKIETLDQRLFIQLLAFLSNNKSKTGKFIIL
jgi:hypothetical protein